MEQKGFLLSTILLSALLFSLSFLNATLFGWLSLVGLTILAGLFVFAPSVGRFSYGFLWGLVVYGLHFLWLLLLLSKKLCFSVPLSFFFYLIIVLYSSVTSGCWFCLAMLAAPRAPRRAQLAPLRSSRRARRSFTRRLGVRSIADASLLRVSRDKLLSPSKALYSLVRLASFFFVAVGYFLFLDRYMFWLFGIGYPFLNPLAPLLRHRFFVWALGVALSLFGLGGPVSPKMFFMPFEKSVSLDVGGKKYAFFYLSPCREKSLHGSVHEIAGKLRRLNLSTICHMYDHIFVVAPETTLRYPLNKHEHYVTRWASALPKNSSLLLGSTKVEDRKLSLGGSDKRAHKAYQTVYWTNGRLIMQSYDKTHRVSFVEKVPSPWKRSRWLRSLFLSDALPISRGKNEKATFMSLIRPVLCSEFFFSSYRDLIERDGTIYVVFVNDSWFCSYFRELLKLASISKALLLGGVIIFVGHP